MLHIALYQPEIPPNAGNVIRLSANTGARLHLIHPLGFSLEDRYLRRAGLDYHDLAHVEHHDSLPAMLEALPDARLLAFSTIGETRYDRVRYRNGDILLFGPETRGLPRDLLAGLPAAQRIHLPMQRGNRSLNLSNAVAVAAFEAWRQWDFRTD